MRITWVAMGSMVAGLLSVGASLVSSPDYGGLVSIALVLAALSLACALAVLIRSRTKAKWAIMTVVIPVVVFMIDNIGRMLMILHSGGFRILI